MSYCENTIKIFNNSKFINIKFIFYEIIGNFTKI